MGGEFSEGASDGLIHRPLEGDDQFGKPGQLLPTPRREFSLGVTLGAASNVDLGLGPDVAKGEPFLKLAAISPAAAFADQRRRKIVGEPFRDFPKTLDRADAGLLEELADCGALGLLVVVDPAL